MISDRLRLKAISLSFLTQVGGATLFYGDKGRLVARTTPRPGLCLVHEHGENCLEHEAEVVRQGVKYVLRSDIVFES